MEYRYSNRHRYGTGSEYRQGYGTDAGNFSYRRPLRRSRDGLLLGVCQGFADWLEIPAWPLRLGLVIACIAGGFSPAGLLYIAAALLMKPAPR